MDTRTMWARETMRQAETVEGLVRFLKKMGCGAESSQEELSESIDLVSAVRISRTNAKPKPALTNPNPSRQSDVVPLSQSIRIRRGVFAKT